MKMLRTAGVAISLLLSLGLHAQTTNFYDAGGKPIGSATNYNGTVNYYDSNNMPLGSSINYGVTTNYYDPGNLPVGSSTYYGHITRSNSYPQATPQIYIDKPK
jgi:hypothetical protein